MSLSTRLRNMTVQELLRLHGTEDAMWAATELFERVCRGDVELTEEDDTPPTTKGKMLSALKAMEIVLKSVDRTIDNAGNTPVRCIASDVAECMDQVESIRKMLEGL